MKDIPETVLFFMRAPEPGRVKTRLIGKLGTNEVCRLYRCFVEDVLANLSVDGFDVTICFDPPESKEKLMKWLGASYTYVAQKGATLGEKMQHAFATAFLQGTERAVLIGSDLPDLEADIIRQAFEGLSAKGVVLGPAVDGGYYLIGFTADCFDPAIFKGIDWGTRWVFDKTVSLIKKRNLALHLLPERHDIDTHEDLKTFLMQSEKKGRSDSKTIQYLHGKMNIL